MFDTHCHLADENLYKDLPKILERAAAAGVTKIMAVATRIDDSRANHYLASRYPGRIYATAGIHPHHAEEITAEELKQVCKLFANPTITACGEMGLDYHYNFAPKEAQRRVFEAQLAAAIPTGKSLVLHCREAVDESLAMLEAHPFAPAVFHCFTGTADEARKILDAGYHLGFTGIVTFKNTQYLRDLLTFVPFDRLLLETDAPYLSPEPMRKQKHNEPSLIVHTFRRVAEIKQIAFADLISETTATAKAFFQIG